MRGLRWILIGLLAVYWIVLFAMTHTPARQMPRMGMGDKLAHFGAYFILGSLVYCTVWITRPGAKTAGLWVIAVGMTYGAIDEWTQILVGRDCELMDWVADMAGMSAAVLVMSVARHLLFRQAFRIPP